MGVINTNDVQSIAVMKLKFNKFNLEIALLSIEKQIELARAAAEGDEIAWQELHESFEKALIGYIESFASCNP